MSQSEHSGTTRESIESLLSTITESDTKLAEMRTRQAAVRGRGVTAGGRVVAEVLPTGALVGLSIDPRAMRLGAEDLADEVLAAVKEAAKDAADRAAELMEPAVFLRMSDRARGEAADDGTDIEQVLAALRDVRRQHGL